MDNIIMAVTNRMSMYSPLQIAGIVAVYLASFWIITIIFRTMGLIATLEQAISKVIQEICTIFLAAFQLSIKLIEAVEFYLVLLIDILTGKTASEQKICVLAGSALSIASFYTTYRGWQYITDNQIIVVLLTIGIQTLLLRTSLRIGMEIDWSKTERGNFKKTLWGIVVLFSLATAGYIVNKTALLPYFRLQAFNHIVTYFSIAALLWIFFSYMYTICKLKTKNGQTSGVLFVIYFATLTVSSFFSFQSFFVTLYSTEIRLEDQFTDAKQEVIQSISAIDSQIDADFYLSLSELISQNLKTVKDNLDTSANAARQALETELKAESEHYAEYEKAMAAISKANNEIVRLNTSYENEKTLILGNPGNQIGYQTRMVLQQLENQWTNDINAQKAIIGEQESQLSSNPFYNSPTFKTDYETKLQQLTDLSSQEALSSQLARTSTLLLMDEWTETEAKEFLTITAILQTEFPDTSIGIIAPLMSEYKRYRYEYRVHSMEISGLYLGTSGIGSDSDLCIIYDYTLQQLFDHAHAVLAAVPGRSAAIRIDGQLLMSTVPSTNEVSSFLEQIYTDTNRNRHIFHQNMTAFWRARIPGILSALIAVMIDNLILFVGLVSPRQLEYFQDILKHDPERKKIMLEHFFSKPSKRA